MSKFLNVVLGLQIINKDTNLRLQTCEERVLQQEDEILRLREEIAHERAKIAHGSVSNLVTHAEEVMKNANFGDVGDCDFDHRFAKI